MEKVFLATPLIENRSSFCVANFFSLHSTHDLLVSRGVMYSLKNELSRAPFWILCVQIRLGLGRVNPKKRLLHGPAVQKGVEKKGGDTIKITPTLDLRVLSILLISCCWALGPLSISSQHPSMDQIRSPFLVCEANTASWIDYFFFSKKPSIFNGKCCRFDSSHWFTSEGLFYSDQWLENVIARNHDIKAKR